MSARDRLLKAFDEVDEKLTKAKREVITLRQEKRRLQARLEEQRPHITPLREELRAAKKVAQSLRQHLVDARSINDSQHIELSEVKTRITSVYVALAGIETELTASPNPAYQAGGRAVVREIREILAP